MDVTTGQTQQVSHWNFENSLDFSLHYADLSSLVSFTDRSTWWTDQVRQMVRDERIRDVRWVEMSETVNEFEESTIWLLCLSSSQWLVHGTRWAFVVTNYLSIVLADLRSHRHWNIGIYELPTQSPPSNFPNDVTVRSLSPTSSWFARTD